MKNLIRIWLGIPSKEELREYINERIDTKVQSRVARSYAKLKKSDKDRYRNLTNSTSVKCKQCMYGCTFVGSSKCSCECHLLNT